jgi:hypothetical protein
MLGMRTRMLSSKVSTVGRTSRPVYHSGEPRSPHERIPTPVWRKHVKQRERDLPHAALVPVVKAKRGAIQLQGPKKKVWIALMRTPGRASAYKRNISSRRCIHSARPRRSRRDSPPPSGRYSCQTAGQTAQACCCRDAGTRAKERRDLAH